MFAISAVYTLSTRFSIKTNEVGLSHFIKSQKGISHMQVRLKGPKSGIVIKKQTISQKTFWDGYDCPSRLTR